MRSSPTFSECSRRRARRESRFHSAYIVDLAAGPVKPFHPVMADGTSAFSDAPIRYSAICAEVAPAGDECLLTKSDDSSFAQAHRTALPRPRHRMALRRRRVDRGLRRRNGQGRGRVRLPCHSGQGRLWQRQPGDARDGDPQRSQPALWRRGGTNTLGACRLMAGETVDVWTVEGTVPLRFSYANAAELYRDL